jgi:hypothetical protein
MPIRQELADPFGSFVAGRQARQQEDYGRTRNALADMELQNAPQEMQRRNALADVQMQSAKLGLQGQQQQIDADKARTAHATLEQALRSGNAKEFVLRNVPDLVSNFRRQHGVDFASLSDEEAKAELQHLSGVMAGAAGIAPAQPKTPEAFTLGSGQTRYGPDGKPIASAPVSNEMTPYQQERLKIERERLNRPDKQKNSFRTLTPEEVQAAGLPAGTSAQVDQSGKIDVLSKKDTTATLSQKDSTVAKIKLNQLKVAKQQLQNVRAKFAKIKGTIQAGKGQGWVPFEEGEAFDKAVDSMKGSLTAITRVPGVGSMSDYESRIDQSKFPKRGDYESVTEDQIQAVEDLLTTIESGYTDLLGGGSQQTSQAPQAPAAAPKRVKVDAQGNVLGN